MDNRGKTIFFGVLIGAVTGLIAAILLNRRVMKDDRSTAITAGEGLRLSLLVIGLLRAITALGDEDKKR